MFDSQKRKNKENIITEKLFARTKRIKKFAMGIITARKRTIS